MFGNDVPHLDQVLEDGNLRAGVAEVLSILEPEWDAEKVEIKDMSTGYANKNYSIRNGSEGLFLRLINPHMDGFLNIAVSSMRYLKRRKIGAQLLLTFKNGLVMELLDGKGISWDEFYLVKEPETWRGLAREMARYHGTTNVRDITELGIMDRHQYVDFFRPQFEVIDSALESLGLPLCEEIFAEREKVYQSLLNDGAEVGFCHMDANPTNVLLTANGPIYIDYDMCLHDLFCVNLAYQFCFTSNVTNTWNPDENPNEQEKDVFIREYLNARSENQPGFGPVDEPMVEHWKFLTEKASLVFYLNCIYLVVIMQTVSTKAIDIGMASMFWKRYKNDEKLLTTK